MQDLAAVSESLYTLADAHAAMGYSVIPLWGDADPERAKVAAIGWKDYQYRRADKTEFGQWFLKLGYQALGIVTGRISGLVVMDFDDPNLYTHFCAAHPNLARAHVIQTRRGYHIYYQLPPQLYIQTRKGQGVDLLAEGCYVVARPSVIHGFAYTGIKGGNPQKLTADDIKAINAFLDRHQAAVMPNPPVAAAYPVAPNPDAINPQALYHANRGQGKGRNQSLFDTACLARDFGWSQAAFQNEVAELFVHTIAYDHPAETHEQRRREGLNTIRSAFSQPARAPRAIHATRLQIPTRAREQLYMLGLTCAVRTIEGLRILGVQPGHTFTRQEAITMLKGAVGRNSIDNALHALTPKGLNLIVRDVPPSLYPPQKTPPASNDAAQATDHPDLKKCIFEGKTNPGKIKSGRKPHRYIMPSNNELIYRLGVQFSSSDPILLADLTSAKKTRQASHRELLRRRPGQYLRRWLGQRIGVTGRTTQRYDKDIGTHVQPMFQEVPITWNNLNAIPDEPVPGMFLQDDTRRCYPAKREIAVSLLHRVRALYLMRQEGNLYTIDEPRVALSQIWKFRKEQQEQLKHQIIIEENRRIIIPSPPIHPAAQPRSDIPPPEAAIPKAKVYEGVIATKQMPLLKDTPPKAPKEPKTPKAQKVPEVPKMPKMPKVPRQAVRKMSPRRARKPLPNPYAEGLVQRVYNFINARVSDRKQHISQATIRRCVSTYGLRAVENALKCLMSRQNIRKPAGFFMTILRSESKKAGK